MMNFIRLRFINNFILLFGTLIFIFCTHKSYAEERIDEKCCKSDKQILSWVPKGLEVDSQGNIYINFAGGINVYNSLGAFKYSLKVKTYGAYEINIDSNDLMNVALVREDKIIVYDKNGFIVQEKKDYNNVAYYDYKKNNKIKKDAQGNEYKLSNVFGYTKVVKINSGGEKSIIYKITLAQWSLKLLVPIFMIFFSLIVPLIFIISKRNTKIA